MSVIIDVLFINLYSFKWSVYVFFMKYLLILRCYVLWYIIENFILKLFIKKNKKNWWDWLWVFNVRDKGVYFIFYIENVWNILDNWNNSYLVLVLVYLYGNIRINIIMCFKSK